MQHHVITVCAGRTAHPPVVLRHYLRTSSRIEHPVTGCASIAAIDNTALTASFATRFPPQPAFPVANVHPTHSSKNSCPAHRHTRILV
jgi:hypothetical protein